MLIVIASVSYIAGSGTLIPLILVVVIQYIIDFVYCGKPYTCTTTDSKVQVIALRLINNGIFFTV